MSIPFSCQFPSVVQENEVESMGVSFSETDYSSQGEKLIIFLKPMYRDVLPCIINNLNVRSFLNLASTCKYVRDVLFTTRGIHITHEAFLIVDADDAGGTIYKFCVNKPLTTDEMESMKKLPLAVNITGINVENGVQMDSIAFQKLDAFLFSMNVKSVGSLVSYISDWDSLVSFAWKYKLNTITNIGFSTSDTLSDEVLDSLQALKISEFWYTGYIPTDAILRWNCPYLNLQGSNISRETVMKIIKQWLHGERKIQSVSFGVQMSSDVFDTVFAGFHCIHEEAPLPKTFPFVIHQPVTFLNGQPIYNDDFADYWLVKEEGIWLWCGVIDDIVYLEEKDGGCLYPDLPKLLASM